MIRAMWAMDREKVRAGQGRGREVKDNDDREVRKLNSAVVDVPFWSSLAVW